MKNKAKRCVPEKKEVDHHLLGDNVAYGGDADVDYGGNGDDGDGDGGDDDYGDDGDGDHLLPPSARTLIPLLCRLSFSRVLLRLLFNQHQQSH